ncbi:flippase [Paraferrimonas haliotis]|nr:flippase [Paraferrimonas haliotis]
MKALINIAWLYLDRIISMALGIISNAIVARYLGPEQYGVIAYALAIASFLMPLINLGSDTILYDCIARRRSAYVIANSFVLRVVVSILLLLLSLIYLLYSGHSDANIWIGLFIVASVMVKACDVLQIYFDANHDSKINSVATVKASSLALLFKLAAVAMLLPLVWFAAAYLLQAILVWVFKLPKATHIHLLKPSYIRWKVIKVLLSRGKFMALAALSILLYTAMDKIMLGQMLGTEAVGIYSAALLISIGWLFLPGAITLTLMKGISKTKNHPQHHHRVQRLFSIIWLVALVVGLTVFALSQPVIHLIFGEQFAMSAQVLQVYVFGSIFAAIGSASYRVLIVHGLYRFCLIKTAIAAVINFLLNYWLIQKYGVLGAAYATVASEFCASIALNACVTKLPILILQIKGLMAVPSFAFTEFKRHWPALKAKIR